ncbi:DNA/RNA non-specific endonuclease [Gordonibacter sp. An230]|uniref:DNA/RNA non-specific endonuclease n=1 Tax=Gordonibacter sp. An230 TaxID=1965592 RepID=UPI001EF51FF8|nr:DNA/RNA non-specific endonuclease [Gordonibacter sp. An230]
MGPDPLPPDVAVETPSSEPSEPSFSSEEIARARQGAFEDYSPLDDLGRCGPALACLGPENGPKPDQERGDISDIHPSGWNQAFYDFIGNGGALWNRCHLIAWQLSAEDDNERNLVTGTRQMNEAMIPLEDEVAEYIDRTGGHVLYRAIPMFEGNDLVARKVVVEAMSFEDGGAGVSFRAVLENVQDGVEIDYSDGTSRAQGEDQEEASDGGPYILNTSSMKIHRPGCGALENMADKNREESSATLEELIDQGYSPCGLCNPL